MSVTLALDRADPNLTSTSQSTSIAATGLNQPKMRLKYLLLIIPAVSAVSIKMTKRRLSDPLLQRQYDLPQTKDLDTSPVRPRDNKRNRPTKRSMQDDSDAVSSISLVNEPVSLATSTGSKLSASTDSAAASTSSGSSNVLHALESSASTGTAATISVSTISTTAIDGTPASSQALSSLVSTGSIGADATSSILPFQIKSSLTVSMPSSTTASNTKSVVSVATEVPLAPVDPWVYTIDVKFGTNNKPVPMLVSSHMISELEISKLIE